MTTQQSWAGTALITGGAGFIGSHLVDRFLSAGWRVRVYDDYSSGYERNLEPAWARAAEGQLEVVRGDIRDGSELRSAMNGAKVVMHLAAIGSVPRSVAEPLLTHDVNVTGTLEVLEAARLLGVARVVFAGSCAVYGDDPVMPKRESLPACLVSPYALQKYMAERSCQLWTTSYGLETVVLRFFNVYGPRQDPNGYYAAVIPLFAAAAASRQPVRIFGDGEQTRDFVYVGDVAEANFRAATTPGLQGGVFNVASGKSTSVNELARAIGASSGHSLEVHYEPERAGDIRHSQADISSLERAFGWRPATPLRDGLEQTVKSFAGAVTAAAPRRAEAT